MAQTAGAGELPLFTGSVSAAVLRLPPPPPPPRGADIRIVHPATRMSIMELKWGLVPDMGGYALWRGLVRDDVLRELIYTNREFSGAEGAGGWALRLMSMKIRSIAPVRSRAKLPNRKPARDPRCQTSSGRHDRGAAKTDAILLEESIEQHAIMRSPNQVEAVMAAMQGRKPDFEDL